MGSNNNKNQPQQGGGQSAGYGPNPGASGNDPRGRSQNQLQYQQQRYESQQGPMANAMGTNYGRGSEQDFGDRTNIMNQYMDIASGGGSSNTGGGGGGGGGGGYSAFTVSPQQVGTERAGVERASSRGLGPLERVTVSNPFESYGGMKEFSQTGGYSPQDVSNMRARGMSPIRAAYGNAERNVGQQRSLQGGYSPNAIAAQAKMAREQGQSMSDAAQNVEAGIAQQRQQGRLSGLQGMSSIEQAKLNAQMQGDIFNAGEANSGQKFDIGNEMQTSQFNAGQGNEVGMFNAGQGNQMGQFNADLDFKGQQYNADAQARAQAQNNAAAASGAASSAAQSADNQRMRLAALEGASSLYGTTPGMSNVFGNQLINAVGQGGNMGMGYVGAEQRNGQLPGQYEQNMGRVSDTMNLFGRGMDILGGAMGNGRPQQQQQRPPSYQIPVNQNFNPMNYGQSYQLGPAPFNPYGQTYDEG